MSLERRLALAFDVEIGVTYPNNPTGRVTDLMSDAMLLLLARAAIATIDIATIRVLFADALVIMKHPLPSPRAPMLVAEWERRVQKVLLNTQE